MKTDVLIIGGGVIGCGIAHQLCKYNFDVTLVEKKQMYAWEQVRQTLLCCTMVTMSTERN